MAYEIKDSTQAIGTFAGELVPLGGQAVLTQSGFTTFTRTGVGVYVLGLQRPVEPRAGVVVGVPKAGSLAVFSCQALGDLVVAQSFDPATRAPIDCPLFDVVVLKEPLPEDPGAALPVVPPPIPVVGAFGVNTQDEGAAVNTPASTLNFVGAGVTAADAGAGVTEVTIPGAAGAAPAFQYSFGASNNTTAAGSDFLSPGNVAVASSTELTMVLTRGISITRVDVIHNTALGNGALVDYQMYFGNPLGGVLGPVLTLATGAIVSIGATIAPVIVAAGTRLGVRISKVATTGNGNQDAVFTLGGEFV